LATFSQAVHHLRNSDASALLAEMQRGIEKEGLRCTTNGSLSQQPHPRALGSALTHSSITTDYSEALLEFITPVFNNASDTLGYLENLHKFSFQQMKDELIWPASMPCILDGELSIPIADYGSSLLGQLKHAYRHGLWHRYGRTMQAIAGIHYNFSVPEALWPELQKIETDESLKSLSLQDYKSVKYFALIRNFRRNSWLLLFLFGASPAVCESFLTGQEHQLNKFKEHTLYAPYATSLRMSDLGYQNNAQSSLKVCYNSLSNYINTLSEAIDTSIPAYEEIGLQDGKGQFKQLNTNLLQIENEYYSDIRPKRVSKNGEKPLEALDKYGVEYIEVRCTDVNPFLPLGISEQQIHFLDLFLLHCLLEESPELSEEEYNEIQSNQHKTVMEGRKPNLMLERKGQEISLSQWAEELLEQMQPLVELLDDVYKNDDHSSCLQQQLNKVHRPELTPSARYMEELEQQDLEFSEFTLQLAQRHAEYFSQQIAEDISEELKQEATRSIEQQRLLEAESLASGQSFADYLADYLKR